MKTAIRILTCFSILFILMSCHKDSDSEADSIFHTWEAKHFISLESLGYPKIDGNRILITFNTDGTYHLQLDMNQCNGTFQPGSQSLIIIGAAGCTKICCDSDFSIKLAEMLPKVTSFKIDGNSLQLNVPQWGWIEFERVK